MRIPDSTESAASLLKEAQEIVETRLEFARLTAVEKSAAISGSMMFILTAFLLAICLLIMLSLGLAFFISARTGSKPAGFLAVGSLYFVFLLICYVFRNRLIRSPLTNALISKLMQ